MALKTGPFPYDVNNLLGGRVRFLLTPYDPADPAPATPADIFAQKSPYAAIAPYTDLGATKEAFQYGRSIDVGGYQIQQEQGNVIEEITNVARTVQVSVAEIGPDGLALIEQQPDVEDIVGTADHAGYKALGFGTIADLRRYRVAFVAQRSQASGLVHEVAGDAGRGRWVVGVGYNVAVSADNVQLGMAKGELAAAQVTFAFFPDSEGGHEPGKEYGTWFFEESGTFAGA